MPDEPQVDELDQPPTAEEIEGWPTGLAVAAQFGKTPRWVGQMCRAGQLHPRLDSRGARRFDPDEIDALLPNASTVAIQNQDGIVRILSETAKSLGSNNAELLRIIPGPMKQLLDQQAGLITALFARITRLEDERVKMIAAHEEAMSALHERELATYKAKKEQERLDQALKNLSEALPKFMDQLFIGRDMSALLQTLDPTMLEALTADDTPLLDAEQKVRLKGIVERLRDSKKPNGQGEMKQLEAPATPVTPAAPPTEVVS